MTAARPVETTWRVILPSAAPSIFAGMKFAMAYSFVGVLGAGVFSSRVLLPALKNGYVTFGSFNGYLKLSDATLRLWGRILARVPGSVQQDLMASGRVPDPFKADNQAPIQWAGLTNWQFRKVIDVTPAIRWR